MKLFAFKNVKAQDKSPAASKAFLELDQIQGKRGIWFCGTYQGCGFHEDGLKAGKAAAQSLLGKKIGPLANPKADGPVMDRDWGTSSGVKISQPVHLCWQLDVATEAGLGLADAYINGCFSFINKREDFLNLFLILIANSDPLPVGLVDTRELKQGADTYFRYVGSLTAPPCTENIIWNIFAEECRIDIKIRLERFRFNKPWGFHFKHKRHVQPLTFVKRNRAFVCLQY